MLISGPPRSGKTAMLVNNYLNLVNSGIDTEEILVICSNSARKQDFVRNIKENLTGGYPLFRIHTFHGIVYNTLNTFWPLIEKRLKGKHQILPHLTGLETCELLLKECVKTQNAKNNAFLSFDEFYGKRSLIIQLIRRYRLMSENMLSFEELHKRSQTIDQSYSLAANECLKCLKLKTSQIRVLDFVTQMNAFNILYTTEPIVKEYFQKVKHLIADDYDEETIACQKFVEKIIPEVESFMIAFDPDGGTRRGYLSAYDNGWKNIVKIRKSEILRLDSSAPVKIFAEELYTAIKSQKRMSYCNNLELVSTVSRLDMLDELTKTLDMLLFKENISIEDIIVVIPSMETALKTLLQDYCSKNGINCQFLTGSNRPVDNNKVYGALILIQLLNPQWHFKPVPFDIRLMLTGLMDFPPLIADKIAQEYEKYYKKENNPSLPNLLLTEGDEDISNSYSKLIKLIENIKDQKLLLYDQLINIFKYLIAPGLSEKDNITDFNRILESLNDFNSVIDKFKANAGINLHEKDWFIQVKNELIAENPTVPDKIKPNTLVIATPQKIVDMQLTTSYQIWFDISSTGWTRKQSANLYNAWAYSEYYDGSIYDENLFTRSITAHVIRGLVYNCNKKIIALASTLDSVGYENQGWLIKHISSNNTDYKTREELKLRDDQSGIVEYKKGTMAVAAVPGSGKTYVNVILIVKLIEKGINPENILVLTYMDSASQTLIKRIKTIFPDMEVLPHISTIHGLAFKIIRDDDNLAKLNLPEDIGVADDSIRPALLNYIASATLPEFDDAKKWREDIENGIKLAKSYNITPEDIVKNFGMEEHSALKEFYVPYKMYCKELQNRGLIDFDDQIRLAIKLLKEFPAVRKKYQDKYIYVIEDEAQDSTILQQELLSLIVEGHNNYIRTGDINQAIMTTFTPVDVEGFRKFIDTADTQIWMDKSQRCAEPVYSLANDLIDWSRKQNNTENAFLNIKMKAVEGKNPSVQDSVFVELKQSSEDEMEYVADRLVELKKKLPPDSSYAVLVRTNKDAINWTRYLDSRGFNCICRTDNLQQRKDFNLIYSFLKVIYKPYNNDFIRDLYEAILNANLLEDDQTSRKFLEELYSPFISCDVSQLTSKNLIQLYMDILYWLEYANLPASELIVKLSKEIFDDAIDRSNGFILSTLADKHRFEVATTYYQENFTLSEQEIYDKEAKPALGLPETIDFFDNLIKNKRGQKFKFLDRDEEDRSLGGFVQIMTIHKAKGSGFDVVFLPHLWENPFYYCTKLENVLINSLNRLEMQLLEIAGKQINREHYELTLKQKQLEETLRLIYVAITRAKKYIFLTSSGENNTGNFKRKEQPSAVFDFFMQRLNKELTSLSGEIK